MIVCSCNILSDGDVKACLKPGPDCPRTPAQVYRSAIAAIETWSRQQSGKAFAELDLGSMTVTSLRFATACGMSDRLRLDLVVNDFVASAVAARSITILSDGSPWRPLVHIRDIIGAFEACLTAPVEAIHNEAFNIGRTAERLGLERSNLYRKMKAYGLKVED